MLLSMQQTDHDTANYRSVSDVKHIMTLPIMLPIKTITPNDT